MRRVQLLVAALADRYYSQRTFYGLTFASELS
jgi:hypothetical protein